MGTMEEEVFLATGCDAAKLYGVHVEGNSWQTFDVTFECLRLHGYNSIQFTRHMEHSVVLYEIVHLDDTELQTSGCFGSRFTHKYRSGWDGSQACHCIPHGPEGALNCGGYTGG